MYLTSESDLTTVPDVQCHITSHHMTSADVGVQFWGKVTKMISRGGGSVGKAVRLLWRAVVPPAHQEGPVYKECRGGALPPREYIGTPASLGGRFAAPLACFGSLASLGYPLLGFNKNTTLRPMNTISMNRTDYRGERNYHGVLS